ncbi:glycosyltransferase family 39 protein [Paenibacillus harenae]|uniref:glycosyltransferase family 39 protein n=1 Tax=Paenibacillus harenae TaxID=306543 RepID=UPI00278E2683|nr:glycosyltransferase family 39 protein [Paenibacillus harenae]MDQ0058857.1 Gpi18-like mannosyltransferase [Paenibacillus harenae]
MIRNQSLRAILSLFMLLILLPMATGHAAGNLLMNGGFEQLTSSKPDAWEQAQYVAESGVTNYGISETGTSSGSVSVVIENKEENHARWTQRVAVEAEKTYKFSGYVKTEGLMQDRTGAHFFVDGVAADYPNKTETGGQWAYLEFYGKTGKGQKEITFGASLGGYGSLNAGKAYFDDASIEMVNEVPEGAQVFNLLATTPAEPDDGAGAEHHVSIIPILIYSLLFTLLFIFIYKTVFRSDKLKLTGNSPYILLWLLLIAAFALRAAIAVSTGGYATDIALFVAWADHAVSQGLSGFYNSGVFVDYPPGYIYVLYVLGSLKSALGIQAGTDAALLLFKMPAIVADLGAAYFIFHIAGKKLSPAFALGLAILYAFNPAVIVDSAAWGQVDSIFTLVLVLSFYNLADSKIERASVWFAIAALIKPQAFIFMPVLLLYFLHRKAWRQIPVSAFFGFATFGLLALPYFWGNGGLSALLNLYSGTLSSYPYASLNAFNFYTLIGANWKGLDQQWLLLTFKAWGNLFIVAAVALAVYFSFRKKKDGRETSDNSFYLAGLLITVVFMLVTKMHERYLFPVLLLSVVSFMQTLDRRMLYLFFGFSLTSFINVAYVLDYSKAGSFVPMNGILMLTSMANVGLLLYMLYIGYDMYKRGRTVVIAPFTEAEAQASDYAAVAEFKPFSAGEGRGRKKTAPLARLDWIWMGAITLIYAVVALFHLGSLNGPVSAWQPNSSGQSFYVDLGESKQLTMINSFGGAGTGKYKYEFSDTADEWSGAVEVESSHVAVFKWNSQQVDAKARYVRLTAVSTGFSMHELAFFEQGSDQPLPIAAIHADEAEKAKRGSVQQLFDEQGKVKVKENFMNSSYFDEIYHARTAYEHLENIVAYENTHPPLGKLIIAIGIKLFGLNTFGWRIAGTVVGIGMVPLIYMMARSLLGRTSYAVTASILLAADFMHFAQTRIATIDVYGVFFIMLMFYFMHRYSSLSFYKEKLQTTLLPLFLAGLFFGIGVASKWIVLYGGIGLAVMLALSLYDRYRQYASAKRLLAANRTEDLDKEQLTAIVKVFPKYTIMTLASCIVFYAAVPLLIYGLSYIPVLSVMDKGYTIQSFIDYQKNMFSYHSNLVSTHPFSSSWWEWPFMKRPVWYYSGDDVPEGMASTIVALGNPLIWWTGIFAMAGAFWLSIKRGDRSAFMIWIAFLAQYVPWMLVTRLTFLYHYFAMVPFIILSIVYVFKAIEEKKPSFSRIRVLFAAVSVALFILFYPALSGMTVSSEYVRHWLRWFGSWAF